MIYLDNAATTKMFEEGAELYKKYACHSFFNPSAGYGQALQIRKEVDFVRKVILKRLGVEEGSVIFTSGATESNNLAIMGGRRNGKREYVFSQGEHPSVYNVARHLEANGDIVHFVPLSQNGQIDYEKLEKVLNDKTRLISVMHVSNETGAINDLQRVCLLRDRLAPQALVHVDGVQAFCKLDFKLNRGIDFYTISAHKFHGPKGVGALYVKNIDSLKPIIFGGEQEGGFRSGTENVGGIAAMGYAIEKIDVNKNFDEVSLLKKRMSEILKTDCHIHINEIEGSPYILSCYFDNVNGETLMRALADRDVIVGMGSACSSKKAGNRILESMGMEKDKIKSHLRISFCELLSLDEVERAGKIIIEVYNNIRERVL